MTGGFKADLHIHSRYSFDSLMEPVEIVIRAHRVGLQVIAITDHGTIEGALETREYADNEIGIQVIVGEEIGTNIGDIIGLNLTKKIPSGKSVNYIDAIKQIHDQGGTAILAHPFRDHVKIDADDASHFDMIEIVNGRCTEAQNSEASLLTIRALTPPSAGSDAHFYSEIGTVAFPFDIDRMRPSNDWASIFQMELKPRIFRRRYVIGSHIIKLLKKRGIIT